MPPRPVTDKLDSRDRKSSLAFAAMMLVCAVACSRSTPSNLGPGANHYRATEDGEPVIPDSDFGNEDQLVDELFRDDSSDPQRHRTTVTLGPPPSSPARPTDSPPLPPGQKPAPGPDAAPSAPPSTDVDSSRNPVIEPEPTATPRVVTTQPEPPPRPDTPTNVPIPSATPAPSPAPPGTTSRPTPSAGPTATPPIVRPPERPAPPPTTSRTPTPGVPVDNTAISGLWDRRVNEGTAWTNMTVQALSSYGRGLLKSVPADMDRFCPNFSNLGIRGRAAFWVKLISAIAASESSFKPKDFYVEQNNVVSRGLMQLSVGDCNIGLVEDLEDPQKNIECSVKILNKWVTADGVISGYENGTWYGGARYWSTLRSTSKKFEVIRQLVRQSSFCRSL